MTRRAILAELHTDRLTSGDDADNSRESFPGRRDGRVPDRND